jgi:hypothetical protein
MKKTIESFNNPLFSTLESKRMKKITGGKTTSTSQLATFTAGKDTSDGADDLASGETQDAS